MTPLAFLAVLLASAAQAPPAPPPSPSAPPLLRPWGPAAFEEAAAAARPLLVVVSDPACARCRLEEEAGLGDAEAARLLRESFVAVGVDRYERPDLDDLFTTAAEWLGGGAGYPLVVALTPDGRPFAGQGALPGQDAGERAGLHRFLLRAWSSWAHERAAAEQRAGGAAQALRRAQEAPSPGRASAEAALRGLRQAFDPRLGGFGSGASFAPPAALRLLLAALERAEDAPTRTMLVATLDAVVRSSPEPPTLAERALLVEACARAFALTGADAYKRRAAALIDGAAASRAADGTFAAFSSEAGPRGPIAGWEGLMIGALALSASALDRPQDLAWARAAAAGTLARLGPAARLRRSDTAPAVLEDHAFLAEGLLRLDAAARGRERRWLEEATALVDAAVDHWLDGSGVFADAVAGPEAFVPSSLPPRLVDGYDGALPSANGVMAAVLWRLGQAGAQVRYADMGRRVADAFGGAMERAPRGMEGLAAAVVEMGPPPGGEAPPVPEPGYPALVTRDGIAFAAALAPGQPRSAVPLPLRVTIVVPAGTHLLARMPGAADLVGLALSVATPDVITAAPTRYPASRRVEGKWGIAAAELFDGTVALEVPLRALSPDGLPKAVRVRILYQACRDAAGTCDKPEAVTLDAPTAPAAR